MAQNDKGFWSNLGSWFGGSDSSGGSSSGSFSDSGWGTVFQAILGGVSSRSESREAQRAREQEAGLARELARYSGDEQRRTIDFQSRLTDARERNRVARRAAARRGFALGTGEGRPEEVELPRFQDYYVDPTAKPPKG